MCGILLLTTEGKTQGDGQGGSEDPTVLPVWWDSMAKVCSSRGPHSLSTSTIHSQSSSIYLTTSVLSLRGPSVTQQPIVSVKGSFTLAWNGQIYGLHPTKAVEGAPWTHDARQSLELGENDGVILANWIETAVELDMAQTRAAWASEEQARSDAFKRTIPLILDSQVEGEWAFVLVDHITGSVYYGRDAIGRRSLLTSESSPHDPVQLLITSVASPEALSAGLKFIEVDCAGFWVFERDSGAQPTFFGSRAPRRVVLKELQHECRASLEAAVVFRDPLPSERQEALERLHQTLLISVARRVTLIGGQVGRDLSSGSESASSRPSPIAILFSGGLDSALLAWYAHLVMPEDQSIDLLNVAFENPRVLQAARRDRSSQSNRNKHNFSGEESLAQAVGSSSADSFSTPDRLLSHLTYSQLQCLAPNRRWNLVEINVSYEEYQAAREDILAHMHPCESVMDLSLASVLWFASKGEGFIVAGNDRHQYSTPASVYVSGLGADELCGGYSRHRKAFEGRGTTETDATEAGDKEIHRTDWYSLAQELQMDLDRLSTRNLGRDDRVLSSHGREGRYPFLSSEVVSFLASLPLRIKCELNLEQGVGDKLLLRQLAMRAGLTQVSKEKKRAMQFGARSAKMEAGQGKVKGHMKLSEGFRKLQAEKGPQEADQAVNGVVYDRPSAPQEVFTTLCYYIRAPRPGQAFPVEDFLLPPTLFEVSVAKVNEAGDSNSSDPLFEHIPLLQGHLHRLATSRREMCRLFPEEWNAVEGDVGQVELDAQVLSSLREALCRFENNGLTPENVAGNSDSHSSQRRRVRVSLSTTGKIEVVVAKMAPWIPWTKTTTPSALLPTVRLDTQSTGPKPSIPNHHTSHSESLRQSQRNRAAYVHKTSDRQMYDVARSRVGATLGLLPSTLLLLEKKKKEKKEREGMNPCFDVLMWTRTVGRTSQEEKDVRNLLTESSIANVLIEVIEEEEQGEGEENHHGVTSTGCSRWLTPRLIDSTNSSDSSSASSSSSLHLQEAVCFLPGLMRSYLLNRRLVQEADLSVEELIGEDLGGRRTKRRFWLCNALRGVWEVRLDLQLKEG